MNMNMNTPTRTQNENLICEGRMRLEVGPNLIAYLNQKSRLELDMGTVYGPESPIGRLLCNSVPLLMGSTFGACFVRPAAASSGIWHGRTDDHPFTILICLHLFDGIPVRGTRPVYGQVNLRTPLRHPADTEYESAVVVWKAGDVMVVDRRRLEYSIYREHYLRVDVESGELDHLWTEYITEGEL